jgi:hypothetical protein
MALPTAPAWAQSNQDLGMSAKPQIVPPAGIAVIGLGNMGVPMGACLVGAGYGVTGFDLSEAARGRFVAAGGRAADDIASAVGSAELVITLLPNGKIVRDAVDAMRPHLEPASILVEMSSSAPLGTRKLGEELIAAGHEFIDAPVSGGVKRAADGTLAIMVGGDPATIDRVDPVLAAMGRSIFRTGALGSGHAMKALNNYVSAAGPGRRGRSAPGSAAKFGLDPGPDGRHPQRLLGQEQHHRAQAQAVHHFADLRRRLSAPPDGEGRPHRGRASPTRSAFAAPLADLCAETLWGAAAVRALSDNRRTTPKCIRYMEQLMP